MKSSCLFTSLRRCRLSVVAVQVAAFSLFIGQAKADQNWDGDNAIGNFSFANNWFGNTVGGLSGFGFANGSLNFSFRNNTSQTSLFYDFAGWAQTNDIRWASTFGAGLSLNGNGQGLDFNQRLENNSFFTQTIGSSMNLSGAKNGATQIELNPVNGGLTINGSIFNDNSRPYFVYGNNGQTLTLNSALGVGSNASAVSLNVAQNSNVVITATQTFTGGTVISAGSVSIGDGGTTGALAGTGAITNNASLIINRSDAMTLANDVSGTGSLTKNGAGTATLTGTNTYGATTITAGTLQVGNGGTTGSLGTGNVTNNGTLTFNRATGSNFLLTNAIGGTGVLQQSGGNIISISSANTYSGVTNINSGVIRVTANDSLGTSGGGTVVASGGQLRLGNSVNYTTAEPLTITGTGADGNGALYSVNGTNSFAGPITVASNATIKNNGTSLDLNGGIVKNGTVLTLGGTGTININGTGISGSAPNSDLIVDTATVVVNAASNYNGPTTVQSNGTLAANAAITTTQLTVDAGSTLAGNGSINAGSGNVYLNGTFVAGAAAGGGPREDFAVTASSTIAGNNSTLKFDLFSRGGDLTGTATAADTLLVNGNLSLLSSVVLEIANAAGLSGWAAGDKWNIWDVTGTTSGTIATLNAPSLGNPLLGWQFTESSGVLEIIAVPEPSKALFALLGLFGLCLRRRR